MGCTKSKSEKPKIETVTSRTSENLPDTGVREISPIGGEVSVSSEKLTSIVKLDSLES